MKKGAVKVGRPFGAEDRGRDLFSSICETSPAGVVVIDRDGRVSFANPQAENVLGLTRSSIARRTFDDPQWKITALDGGPFPPEDLPFNRVKKTNAPVRDVRHAIVWPSGKRVLLSVNGSPLRNPEGEFDGVVATVEDITAEVALQEERRKAGEDLIRSEQFIRGLVEALPVGLLHLDADGIITYENPALRRMMGVPEGAPSPVVSKHLPDLPPFAAIGLASEYEELKRGRGLHRKNVPWRSLMGPDLVLDITAVPVFDSRGVFSGAELMVMDVTEQAAAQRAVKESERRARETGSVLETIFDTIPDVLGLQDTDHRILRYNRAGYAYLGVTPEQVKGKRCFELIGRDRPCEICATSEVYRTRKPAQVERYFPEIESWLDIRSYPVLDENGDIALVLEHLRDITSNKKAEIALMQSEKKYRNLVEQSNDAIYLLYGGKFEVINKRFEEMFGITLEQANSPEFHFLDMVAPRSQALIEERERQLQRGGEPAPIYEFTAVTPAGKLIECETSVTYLDFKEGKATQGVIRDITERKRVQERIEASLREKEILLKEIHHRVKNNLQIVCSLLHIQASGVEDPENLRILQECRNRIRSMALIHDRLYRSADFARIDLTDYTVRLINELFAAYHIPENRIERNIEIRDVSIGLDKAVPVGLILNELVANAIKYAFPDKQAGRIEVGMIRDETGKVVLSVSDNGVGLPAGMDLNEPKTLGLQIVQSLVGQLDGSMEIVRDAGTSFRIRFPL